MSIFVLVAVLFVVGVVRTIYFPAPFVSLRRFDGKLYIEYRNRLSGPYNTRREACRASWEGKYL